jgi:hypothetical protein
LAGAVRRALQLYTADVLVEGRVGNLLQHRRGCTWPLSAPANARKSVCRTPRLVVGGLAHLGLHLGVVHHRCDASAIASWPCLLSMRTILGFPESRLEIVEREIAHLVLEAVEIHVCGRICCGVVVVVQGLVKWQRRELGSAAELKLEELINV